MAEVLEESRMAVALHGMENTQIWSVGFVFTRTRTHKHACVHTQTHTSWCTVTCEFFLCVQFLKNTMMPWHHQSALPDRPLSLSVSHPCLLDSSVSLQLLQLLCRSTWRTLVGHIRHGPGTPTQKTRSTAPTSLLFLFLILTFLSSIPGMQRRALKDPAWSQWSTPLAQTHYARWTFYGSTIYLSSIQQSLWIIAIFVLWWNQHESYYYFTICF